MDNHILALDIEPDPERGRRVAGLGGGWEGGARARRLTQQNLLTEMEQNAANTLQAFADRNVDSLR